MKDLQRVPHVHEIAEAAEEEVDKIVQSQKLQERLISLDLEIHGEDFDYALSDTVADPRSTEGFEAGARGNKRYGHINFVTVTIADLNIK